jgi:kumamolisin
VSDPFAAEKVELESVAKFAARYGLKASQKNVQTRSLVLTGTPAAFARAFHVKFVMVDGPYRYRSFREDIRVPKELGRVIETVVGFDTRPMARHHLSIHESAGVDPRDVARIYDFPSGATGSGQTIGIIEPGGGFHSSDVQAFFRALKVRAPKIKVVNVSGGSNQPAPVTAIRAFLNAHGAGQPAQSAAAVIGTAEVTMDIQLAGALASGAKIVVYFAPPTKQGLFHAFAQAVNDAKNRPDVISCSWGLNESAYQPSFLRALDGVFQSAAAKGITICCSSGDGGSGPKSRLSVTFPASSPHVLACGGTHLAVRPGGSTTEQVWNDPDNHKASGGGFGKFPMPPWQKEACTPPAHRAPKKGRGVPDVAAKADLVNGYRGVLGGRTLSAGGGTSAAAPLWAALVALLNEHLGTRAGYITPLLYQEAFRNRTMRDITQGNNGQYHARAQWDPCSGWGSPLGSELLKALQGRAYKTVSAK